MAEAEKELDAQSEVSVGVLGVAVLSSAATFCCGGQEVVNKPHPVEAKKSETLGMTVNYLLHYYFDSSFHFPLQPFILRLLSVAPRSSAASSSSLMFVRLRVQPPAGKKKGAEGLQLGSVKHSPRREAWLALSKDRYSKKTGNYEFHTMTNRYKSLLIPNSNCATSNCSVGHVLAMNMMTNLGWCLSV